MIRHVSVGAALEHAAFALTEAGIDEPRRRARALLAAALDLSVTEIFAYPERLLTSTQQARVSVMLDRMLAREPLSRIIGRREFWGLEFLLSADTLDPRPESETVVEAVLARLPDRDRALPFSRSRHRHRLSAAGSAVRVPGGERHRDRYRAGRRQNGPRQRRAARHRRAGAVCRRKLGRGTDRPVRRGGRKSSLYRARHDRRAAARGAAIRSDPGARRRRRRAGRVSRDRRRTAAIIAAGWPLRHRDRPGTGIRRRRKFSGSTVCSWTGSPPISPASSALSSLADNAVPRSCGRFRAKAALPLRALRRPATLRTRAKTGNGGGSRCASALSDWG